MNLEEVVFSTFPNYQSEIKIIDNELIYYLYFNIYF